jgi:hypothetical protein
MAGGSNKNVPNEPDYPKRRRGCQSMTVRTETWQSQPLSSPGGPRAASSDKRANSQDEIDQANRGHDDLHDYSGRTFEFGGG